MGLQEYYDMIEKAHAFLNETLALLALHEVGQAALQHWAGVYAFAASFRRPLFAVLQETFSFIVDYKDPNLERRLLPSDVVDEIVCAYLFLPLARVNLRAPLRPSLSISDASEQGGSAGEADRFVHSVSKVFGDDLACRKAAANECSGRRKLREGPFVCGICLAECAGVAQCGFALLTAIVRIVAGVVRESNVRALRLVSSV